MADINGNSSNNVISGTSDADLIKAGGGDDSVSGGAGNDTIFGDATGQTGPAVTERVALEWSNAPGFDNFTLANEFSQVLNGVKVDVGFETNYSPLSIEFTTDEFNVDGIDTDGDPVNPESSIKFGSSNADAAGTVGLDFSDPVENVSFRIADLDFAASVSVLAYDEDGNRIDVDFVNVGVNVELEDEDGDGKVETVEDANPTTGNPDTSNKNSVGVEIAGPVARIELVYDAESNLGSSTHISDIYFDATPSVDPGVPGDDTLIGGAGDDVIYGEAGDDRLDGVSTSGGADSGDDSLFGGDDADVILADGGDVVDGGAGGDDADTLDLTGRGPFYLDNVVTDSNGNGINGTVVFVDGNGAPTGATIVFTEIEDVIGNNVGRGPDAVNDTATVPEDGTVTIPVLANDTDPDGQPLTVDEATSPNGDVTINPDGTITFEPDPDFNGPTTITYTVSDPDGNEDTATVTINVTPVEDAPVANDDTATVPEDGTVTIPVLANDTDPDGQPLTVDEATSPDGDVTINPDGTITFEPDPDFTGPTTITYTVSDPDGNEDTGTVTIDVTPVDDAPDAVDDTATVPEDGTVTIPVLANDTDPDGQPLTVDEATSPNGDVTINPDGTITFEPDPDFNGPTTITYTISDPDGNEDTATVNVTVTPVDDAPDANDDTATTPFNTPVTVPVLANDTDPDGQPLTVDEATSPNGDVTINPDGTITFEPAPGFEGPATITYTISDPDGNEDTADVIVTVGDNPNPSDGIVSGTDDPDLIDEDYEGDPDGDKVDNGDNIFSNDPDEEDDDIIDAGDGDDTVIAGDGSDSVDGGDGDDVIDTDNGSFLIDKGYPGVFVGEEGTDAIFDDRDTVDGGDGDDTIRTGDDNDEIFGGEGDDVIDGGIDDDVIAGEDGDDRIVGGEGEDEILGGDGDDLIYAGNDPALGLEQFNIEDDGSNPLGPDLRTDNGRDTVFGGEGNDTIFGADDDDELYGEEGDDVIDGEIDDDFIDGGIGDDTLTGGQGKDTILGDDGDDVIDGGRNADELFGGEGDDDISGGNGADLLDGGDGDDTLDGGTGDDTLLGGEGDDLILGATGDDDIEGGDGDDTIDGGNGGNDTMSGGADRDTFINVDAGESVDGGADGDDFDVLDLTGSAPQGGSLTVEFTNPDSNGNGFDGIVRYFDQNGDAAGTLEFTEIEDVIPCFTPGTRIATPRGEVAVENLQVGDRVITRDNGIQEIRWIGARALTGAELARATHLRPVLIRKGALGKGLPEQDMMVSPNHRMLVSNDQTELFFEEREVLVAAKHLVGMDGIDMVDASWVTYIHVMFDQHEVILSDGAWSESFQPGDLTLGSMGEAQRNEILELFPELKTEEGIRAYAAARKTLKKHEARMITLD